ncbi:MAG: hypothetical protein BWY05_00342 [Euryarchaeota archaeon ADurb.Bin165]|jgi:hypothetical protein|nr:MAG: hypothetical protein BWY05_00342 [Euryarchaeota archaeon ADurb.Bin165]
MRPTPFAIITFTAAVIGKNRFMKPDIKNYNAMLGYLE